MFVVGVSSSTPGCLAPLKLRESEKPEAINIGLRWSPNDRIHANTSLQVMIRACPFFRVIRVPYLMRCIFEKHESGLCTRLAYCKRWR